MTDSISRRDILRTLGMTALAGSALRAIPLAAAEHAHRVVKEEKIAAANVYTPKFFSPHQWKTLQAVCQAIIPADEDSGGAIEAGAPEFIDLLTSENPEFQLKLGGGMMWLDATCTDRYGQSYLDCGSAQQKEMLDLIAYRANAVRDPGLSPGAEFFSFLRSMTADGFFTSQIGIKYLGYIGNIFVKGDFPGCPPVPES
jgi:gluconate 2-dehydrogenase gamma chain